jgi:hypothetical protein
MPTPNGEITTSTIWTEPQEEVQEIVPVEVKEDELSDQEG